MELPRSDPRIQALLPLTEEDLEDFIIEHSPTIRRKIAAAEKDLKAGKVISLVEYLSACHHHEDYRPQRARKNS